MPFIVKGCTGEREATQYWTVGVCTHEETAQAIVLRLNSIASESGVLMPDVTPKDFHLSFDARDAAKVLLQQAGDPTVPELDYNGVRYAYQEVRSLD